MAKFLHWRWLLALLLGLGSLSAAHASHLLGGDISFATIPSTTAGVPRYHVVARRFVNVYSDGTLSIPLTASRGDCSVPLAGSFTVQVPLAQYVNVMSGCASSLIAYRIAYHEVDLDLLAGEWLLSYTDGNRTAGTLNIPNSGSVLFYISAYLDNSTWTQDASPKIESITPLYLNATALSPYSLSAFDADGDSLRYELIAPSQGCNQLIANSFSPHYTINTSNGQLTPSTSSSAQGLYNLTCRISEYRKGTNNRWALLGYVTRESLYSLYAYTNQLPAFTTMQVNGGAAQSLSAPITAQPGQTVTVSLQATDPDVGQVVRFASNAQGLVPGLSLTTTTSTTSGLLTWQVPASLPLGRYSIPVAVLDNACPYNGSEERTLQFVVAGGQPLASRTNRYAATDVYPVPFRDQVQFTTAPNQAVVLVDALGREVAHLTSAADGRVRWQPAATLPAGLYVARETDGRALAHLLRAGE
jgi:hypothetical protein